MHWYRTLNALGQLYFYCPHYLFWFHSLSVNFLFHLVIKRKRKLLIQKSEEAIKEKFKTKDPLKVKPPVASQTDVINHVRKNPSVGFLYMIYAVHPQNVYFTPYYLKWVSHCLPDNIILRMWRCLLPYHVFLTVKRICMKLDIIHLCA